MSEQDKSLDEIYFFWMERAMKAQRKAKNSLFKKLNLNLTSDQWIIMKSLSEKKGMTQRELAESVSKDPASITRTLDLLEKEKWIVRKKADRRSFTVDLTQNGEKLVKRVIPEAIKYRETGIKNVSEKEMEVFRKVLDTIYQNFNNIS